MFRDLFRSGFLWLVSASCCSIPGIEVILAAATFEFSFWIVKMLSVFDL
jgi:hypothetical protein